MRSRSRSLAPLFLITALTVGFTAGCGAKKAKPEVRVARTSSLNDTTLADANGANGGSFGTNGSWTPGGAPASGDFGATGNVANGGGFGAGDAASLNRDAAGGLPNDASMAGVEGAVPVADLEMVHFEFDKYEITPDWAAVLDKHAEWINGHANLAIQIEGHCDEKGTEEYNVSLGQRRADAVRDYLASKGVDPNRLTTISYGKMRPLDAAGTDQSAALNRRAQFMAFENTGGAALASSN